MLTSGSTGFSLCSFPAWNRQNCLESAAMCTKQSPNHRTLDGNLFSSHTAFMVPGDRLTGLGVTSIASLLQVCLKSRIQLRAEIIPRDHVVLREQHHLVCLTGSYLIPSFLCFVQSLFKMCQLHALSVFALQYRQGKSKERKAEFRT